MSKYEDDSYWATLYKMDAKQYRREANKVISMANKRLARLENSNLTDSPAYSKYVDSKGNARFSVKGLDHNALQREMSKVKKFIQSKTSTVRGVNNTLKEMAKNTGIKYKSLKELRSKARKFFELSSKVEQYLRNVDDIASAIGYQKIWEAINTYVKNESVDLKDSERDIDSMVQAVTQLIKGFESGNQFTLKDDDTNWWFLG